MRPAVQQLRKLEPSREQLIPIMRKYPEPNIYKRFGTSRERVRYLKKSLGRQFYHPKNPTLAENNGIQKKRGKGIWSYFGQAY